MMIVTFIIYCDYTTVCFVYTFEDISGIWYIDGVQLYFIPLVVIKILSKGCAQEKMSSCVRE